MFHLVLYLVLMKAEANVLEAENPVIRLSYIDDRNQNFTVWKDKPLKIVIHNGNIRYIWCSNFYNKDVAKGNFVPETEFTNGDHVLNISSVTAEMSTRWLCVALEDFHGPIIYYHKGRNYTAKNLHFHLHVKGARAVILKANDQILPYVLTNMSVNYDGEANYSYEDGVDFPVDFSCYKAGNKDNNDTLRLEYYDTEGNLLFKTKPRDQRQQMFRFVLKSINNKYYLDCIRAARNPDRKYRYRTTFLKRYVHYDTSEHAVILSVNGQKLTSPLNRDESFDNYIFRYIDGEELTVICQKRDASTSGQLVFLADKMSLTLQSSNSSEQVISLNTSDIQNRSLICGINNVKTEKPNARLLFLSDVPGNDVRIRGLPRNNILYQYTNDLNQWTIEYQYSVNETLDLTCVWNEGFSAPRSLAQFQNPFKWYFVDKSFDSAAISIPNTKVKFSEESLTRTLNENHNGTIIKCIYVPSETIESNSNKTVEINLHLKPVMDSEGKTDEYSSDITYVKKMIVPIAVGVGVAIAVITMVFLVYRRNRTKRIKLIENAYDNTSYQNDSPIPAFPSQWEDNNDDPNYTIIGEEVIQKNCNYSSDNDKLYRMPDKRQSNVSENHYTEINDNIFPKPDGLAANWNTTRTYDYCKQKHTREETSPHSMKNTYYNNFNDSKQGNYDNLRHINLPNNKINQNYSNVPKSSKSENAFRQTSNDFRSEGMSRQDGGPDNDSYNNTSQGNIYTQPGKPIYQNNYLESEKTDNQLNTDYAEPYDELGISCKNDLYG